MASWVDRESGITLYDCVVCQTASIFPLCTDCQIDLGKPLPEIQEDWERYLAEIVRQGAAMANEQRTNPDGSVTKASYTLDEWKAKLDDEMPAQGYEKTEQGWTPRQAGQ